MLSEKKSKKIPVRSTAKRFVTSTDIAIEDIKLLREAAVGNIAQWGKP